MLGRTSASPWNGIGHGEKGDVSLSGIHSTTFESRDKYRAFANTTAHLMAVRKHTKDDKSLWKGGKQVMGLFPPCPNVSTMVERKDPINPLNVDMILRKRPIPSRLMLLSEEMDTVSLGRGTTGRGDDEEEALS